MPRQKVPKHEQPTFDIPRDASLESREQRMIGYAVDLAEKQLRDGSISPMILAHYIKMGSTRELLEQERIRHQNELYRVKAEAIEERERMDQLFKDAIEAMGAYRGIQSAE